MRLIDVDRPEGSIHTARALAKLSLLRVWLLVGLTLLLIGMEVVAAVQGTASDLQTGVSQRIWYSTLLAMAFALVLFERYQGRRLEERVLALETTAKA